MLKTPKNGNPIKYLRRRNSKGLNRIAKIGYGYLCLRLDCHLHTSPNILTDYQNAITEYNFDLLCYL